MKRQPRKRRRGKARGLVGRKPTGRRGELLNAYKQVTVRLPPETVTALEKLSEREDRPQWKVMADAIEAYAAGRKSAL